MPSGDKAQLAIFASGGGSNADKICTYFKSHPSIAVSLILTNRADAGVLQVADRHGIESVYISKKYWSHPEIILPVLETSGITHIILAGFLSLIPDWLIQEYRGHIINIHPALLPKYGGKGMYGNKVHQAVIDAKEKESGITIHYVDEIYDHGNIIFQATCIVDEHETVISLAQKIHLLEHQHYPAVIASLVESHK